MKLNWVPWKPSTLVMRALQTACESQVIHCGWWALFFSWSKMICTRKMCIMRSLTLQVCSAHPPKPEKEKGLCKMGALCTLMISWPYACWCARFACSIGNASLTCSSSTSLWWMKCGRIHVPHGWRSGAECHPQWSPRTKLACCSQGTLKLMHITLFFPP